MTRLPTLYPGSVNGAGAEVLDSTGAATTSGWITEFGTDASLDNATATADFVSALKAHLSRG